MTDTTPKNTTTPSTPLDVKSAPETEAPTTDAKAMAAETKDAASARATELAEKAKTEAAKLGEKAKDAAADKADEVKGYASAEIERQAESLREAGRSYGDDSYQAHAADYLAQNLVSAADIIREKDMGSLVDDVTLFARRNPALFLGGAALLGFAAARMMKATEKVSPRRYADRGFDRPAPGIDNTPYGRPDGVNRPVGGYPQ